MESQLQRDSKKAVEIQEQKAQLEETVVKLRHSKREMKNTLEKFTASIQVLGVLVSLLAQVMMMSSHDSRLKHREEGSDLEAFLPKFPCTMQ